ncbi:MAG: ZIP family metal transporter [Maribacter sp.]|uniref:ZIP family metal transporter n=1 Tax=Maribacter sp. TaxID=1897614 RepID=UPI00329947CB
MYKYILPVIAIFIGVSITIIAKKQKTTGTKLLVSFSGAFLLALALFELLPEVYHHLDTEQTVLFILLGILLQIVLEFFSKGIEHGHTQIHNEGKKLPWVLFVSLCIHSFLEGFPIHQHNDMVYGVLIHKIPIAALITSFLLQYNYSKIQVFGFLLVFAVMTPLGTYISNNTILATEYINIVNAIMIGVFLHIATTVLFQINKNLKFNLSKLVVLCLGISIAYFI